MNPERFLYFLILIMTNTFALAANDCSDIGLSLQVLGSGGPEIDDGRASSGYLVRIDGKARIIVDMGGGSALRFEETGASLNDIDLVLMTHFHVDHSNDLPAFIKASYFTGRDRDLLLYGPTGNNLMPSAEAFVDALFGQTGAFRYLNSYITPGEDDYQVLAHNVDAGNRQVHTIFENKAYTVSAVAVHHGAIPAIAWRVDVGDRSIVFSGDMNNAYHSLTALAKDADILVAHNAVPEDASDIAKNLHMPPSTIGRIAGDTGVGQLVLSHRMKRTLGREEETTMLIRKNYTGNIDFADDLDCFR